MKNQSSASVLTADFASDSPRAVLERINQRRTPTMSTRWPPASRRTTIASSRRTRPRVSRRRNRAAALGRDFCERSDLRAETLRATADGDAVWSEVRWFGHKRDGSVFDARGMTVFGVRAGKVAWGRLYIETVEQNGESANAAIKRITG